MPAFCQEKDAEVIGRDEQDADSLHVMAILGAQKNPFLKKLRMKEKLREKEQEEKHISMLCGRLLLLKTDQEGHLMIRSAQIKRKAMASLFRFIRIFLNISLNMKIIQKR